MEFRKPPLFFLILLYSLALSVWLFFQNPLLQMHLSPESVDWYFHYAQTIFHPEHLARVMYWGESILLPILANLLGASKSAMTYKAFCACLIISIIPIFTILSKPLFASPWKSFAFVNLFGLGFTYLREAGIGYPDPLTILLLGIATLTFHPLAVFISIALAALTHFSMALVATLSLVTLFIANPQLSWDIKRKLTLSSTAGLIVGRMLLELWYRKFNYLHTSGRVHFIIDKGMDFFLNHYLSNPQNFWLTPGFLFLFISAVCVFNLVRLKSYALILSIAISYALSYIVLFITIDGLRGFAVISMPAFLTILVFTLKSIKTPIQNRHSLQNA